MNQDAVMVRVFGSNRILAKGGCSCRTGICCRSGSQVVGSAETVSMDEQVRELEASLARYYGGQVCVEYVDAFSPSALEYPEIVGLIVDRRMPLPLVTMDRDPKLSGCLSLAVIAVELEGLGVLPATEMNTDGEC